MSKASEKAALKSESLETLRALLPAGTEVFSIVRHVSQSGMSRQISFHVVEDGSIRDISFHVARALGYTLDRDRFALKVQGAGMDMCFHVVYSLGRALFPDGHNGESGGYALKSRTL